MGTSVGEHGNEYGPPILLLLYRVGHNGAYTNIPSQHYYHLHPNTIFTSHTIRFFCVTFCYGG
jgi:hypothetical protein